MLFVTLYVFWLLLNARITLEILLIGLPVTAAIYIVSCRLLGYGVKRDIRSFSLIFYALRYVCVLFWNVLVCNLEVTRIILSRRVDIEPGLIFFRPRLESPAARFILANSITLTPGTYTIGLRDGEYCIHVLDRREARLDELSFTRELMKMEAKYRG